MDYKRILMALLKTIRDIVIISGIFTLLTALTVFLKMVFGVSTASVVWFIAIILVILLMTLSHYKEGGKK